MIGIFRALSRRDRWCFFGAMAAIFGVRLVAGWLLPPFQDETYYYAWGADPGWGHFDHPPGIAWIAGLARVGGGFQLFRLFINVAVTLTAPLAFGAARNLRLSPTQAMWAALIVQGSFLGLGAGLLASPDSLVLVFWLLALHEGIAALSRAEPRRWLTAGLAVGLGVLGKYTVALFWPAAVCGLGALRRNDRRAQVRMMLVGMLLSLLAASPHIIWLSQNQWISVAAQLKHGITGKISDIAAADSLAHRKPWITEQEWTLAHSFDAIEPDGEEKIDTRPFLVKALARLADLWGGVLGLWGAFLLTFFSRELRHTLRRDLVDEPIRRFTLLLSAVPLCLFSWVAVFRHAEANWPAMTLIGFSVLLAIGMPRAPRLFWSALGVNILLLLGIALFNAHMHAQAAHNRIARETTGYRELADFLAAHPAPLATETYQLLSEIKFYRPELFVFQLPDLSRPSEATRPGQTAFFSARDFLRSHPEALRLISNEKLPPHIEGFAISTHTMLRFCEGMPLERIDARPAHANVACAQPTHVWYYSQYRKL